jgi:hypothetical protein
VGRRRGALAPVSDVLTGHLDGTNPERLVGETVMEHGFPELRDGYAKLLALR